MRCLSVFALILLTQATGGASDSLPLTLLSAEDHGGISAVIEFDPGQSVSPEPSEFRLLEDGQPTVSATRISTLEKSGKILTVAFAIDTSGSIRQQTVEAIQSGLSALAPRMGPRLQFALVSFADSSEVTSPPGSDAAGFTGAVQSLKRRGHSTALYDGILRAIDLMGADGRRQLRRVLVVSDGKDEDSRHTLSDVTDEATRRNVPVDAISVTGVGTEAAFAQILAAIARNTGGRFYAAPVSALPDQLRSWLDTTLQARVVFFDRNAVAASGEVTKSAGVLFRAPGKPDAWKEISVAIPKTANIANAVSVPWWEYAILAAALAVCFGLLIAWRRREKTRGKPAEREQSEEPVPISVPDPGKRANRHTRTLYQEASGITFPVPRPGNEAALLEIMEGPLAGRRFGIESASFSIGSAPDDDLSISNDQYLSGHHARVLYDNGDLFLYDDKSRNGTFLNGHKISGKGFSLRPGDLIRVGATSLRVVQAEQSSAAALPR
jgi:hypothetical protein